MQHSRERILTTHTGSLPRPPSLNRLIFARERGEPVDPALFAAEARAAVAAVVRQQVEIGLDIINDGEQAKPSYATYVQHRLSGFEGPLTAPAPISDPDFPEYFARLAAQRPPDEIIYRRPCTGPIAYQNLAELQQELDDFRAALAEVKPVEAFLTAASPGIVSLFIPNRYYPTYEAYLFALADALKTEYDAIVAAGFILQVDAPDLALSRATYYRDLSLEQFRERIRLHLEALNHATRDVPPDQLRMHLCWGNYEGPHTRDVPLADIIDIVLQARATAISFEAANPRHAHEWTLWEAVRLPEEKILIPGVIDSTTNFVEHPQLVCQRIVQFARLVGRERVIAGADCGFSTGAGTTRVEPRVAWAKLRALVEGAELASRQLW
jgi:5-methyltetrahydropteroyltriglutamate--homocysteine methyltransferase